MLEADSFTAYVMLEANKSRVFYKINIYIYEHSIEHSTFTIR